MAGALEVLRESGANEAGGAGDEDFHGVLLGGLIMAHVESDAREVRLREKISLQRPRRAAEGSEKSSEQTQAKACATGGRRGTIFGWPLYLQV